jgi:hypothetical protein
VISAAGSPCSSAPRCSAISPNLMLTIVAEHPARSGFQPTSPPGAPSSRRPHRRKVASFAAANDQYCAHASGLASCLGSMFSATAHAAEAIAQEMKNAVHGSRAVGVAKIAGPQTSSVNRLIIPASDLAAKRG